MSKEVKNIVEVLETRDIFSREFKIYGTKEEPLFLARDIAEILGYAVNSRGIVETTRMVSILDDEEKINAYINVESSNYDDGKISKSVNYTFVTEDGLYEILFRSNKPIAKQFKKEVKLILKQLRTTGAVFVQGREAEAIEQYFSNFSEDVKKAMAIDLAKRNEQIQTELRQAKEQIEFNAPKVEAYEEFIDRDKTYSFNDASKLLMMPQSIMVKYLQDVGLITKFYKPSSVAVSKEIAVIKITNWGDQTRITTSGIDYIRKNYKKYVDKNKSIKKNTKKNTKKK